MFKIGEFSKLTQISIRMLRYYDEAGLLKPAKIDGRTGYRLYSADQIPALNRIVYLRDSGFNVSEIAEALGKKDDRSLVEQLDKKYAEIEKAIQSEREKLIRIELAKRKILEQKDEWHFHISIKPIPGYEVLSLRNVIPDYYAEGGLWQRLSAFAAQRHVQISSDCFSIYHDTEYKEADVDVELCAPVKKLGKNRGDFTYRRIEPVPAMAYTMVYGDFRNIAGAYIAFSGWLQKNSRFNMRGNTRQIVHRGPWNESDPGKYLTELQIPLDSHMM